MPVPNPEQTASLISFMFFSFLDPTIWLAYRIPRLTHDLLPPLCDYDYVKNLIKRSYPVRMLRFLYVPLSDRLLQYLDPFAGARKRNLFFGLTIVFHRSLFYQAVIITGLVCQFVPSKYGQTVIFGYVGCGEACWTDRYQHVVELRGKGGRRIHREALGLDPDNYCGPARYQRILPAVYLPFGMSISSYHHPVVDET